MWITEICIGTSTTALVTYLLSKIRCICKNPCSCHDALCIYGSNESHIANVEDEDKEIIRITAKKINLFVKI